jgi:hypothetical protein
LPVAAQYSFNNQFPSNIIEMNVFELQQMNFLAFPQTAVIATNNTTKKVQNYVFRLNEILGKGNFSTVYKGLNELNSKCEFIQMNKSP